MPIDDTAAVFTDLVTIFQMLCDILSSPVSGISGDPPLMNLPSQALLAGPEQSKKFIQQAEQYHVRSFLHTNGSPHRTKPSIPIEIPEHGFARREHETGE